MEGIHPPSRPLAPLTITRILGWVSLGPFSYYYFCARRFRLRFQRRKRRKRRFVARALLSQGDPPRAALRFRSGPLERPCTARERIGMPQGTREGPPYRPPAGA